MNECRLGIFREFHTAWRRYNRKIVKVKSKKLTEKYICQAEKTINIYFQERCDDNILPDAPGSVRDKTGYGKGCKHVYTRSSYFYKGKEKCTQKQ